MLRLSIVIPVVGDPKQLDDTLVSVLENRPANCEILVVHTEPYSDPYELAGEVQFLQARPKAGFGECLNRGLAACQSPIVHVLTCGVEVRPGWADVALRHFRNAEIACVASLVLNRDDKKVLSAGLAYRAEGTVSRIGQGEAAENIGADGEEFHAADALAAFYRASAVRAIGGFPTWAHASLAAVDAGMSLERAGYRGIIEPASRAMADAAMARPERGFRSGRDAERFFWRWASAHGRVYSMTAHAALIAGECVVGLWRPLMLVHLLGRFCGAFNAATSNRPAKPNAGDLEAPLILTSPHFDANGPDRSRPARAA